MVYNAILRQTENDIIFKEFKDKNRYPTSIHVLQSAVSKIARSTKMPTGLKLYRGLSKALPKAFYESDPRGCRGFAEWGFMSTTADRGIAVQYSGVKDQQNLAQVLEIRTSSVNRGACIMDYSQYADENEYLWLPLSFLESSGSIRKEAAKEGVITVVDLLVSANLKAPTCEEIVEQKKTLHVAAFKELADECARGLAKIAAGEKAQTRFKADGNKEGLTVEDVIEAIMGRVKKVLARHEKKEATEYLDEAKYKALVQASALAVRGRVPQITRSFPVQPSRDFVKGWTCAFYRHGALRDRCGAVSDKRVCWLAQEKMEALASAESALRLYVEDHRCTPHKDALVMYVPLTGGPQHVAPGGEGIVTSGRAPGADGLPHTGPRGARA